MHQPEFVMQYDKKQATDAGDTGTIPPESRQQATPVWRNGRDRSEAASDACTEKRWLGEMGFKTILVHLGPDADCQRRLDAAAEFAARQDARLVGLYVCLPMQVPGVAMGSSLSDSLVVAESYFKPAQQQFEAAANARGLRHTWLLELGDPSERLAFQARYADTVVISQGPPHHALLDFHADLTEYLPFAVGAPVIVVPRDIPSSIDPTRILVAWKASSEAAAAVRFALPLLKDAAEVHVVNVKEAGDREMPGTRISRFLSEHDVQVQLRNLVAPDAEAGRIILEEARQIGAGLIVMGVYGHSRLRTRILGGASKDVLAKAEIPVLIAH
jgi:nucleotide-binding universal stress UspA family protein